VIKLPSLLTICSEQKPLKSKDHGKNLLMASTAYQLLIFCTCISKTSCTIFSNYSIQDSLVLKMDQEILFSEWGEPRMSKDGTILHGGKNGKKSFCGHSSMTVTPSNSRKNFLRTKKVETLDGYRRILISIQLRVYGT
jgi:hypothetical protein